MLSAVAARKAALAAQAERQTLESPTPSGSGSTTPAPSRSETPKRKSTVQKSRSATKKIKKSQPKSMPQQTTTADAFRDQTDIIVVQSEDDGSDDAMSGLEEFDEGPSDRNGGASTRRAWSPSQPVADSSDEDSVDDEAENANPLDISTLFPHLSHPKQVPTDDNVLSTFEPVLDENVFILTEDECHQLGLEGNATLVGLDADDSVCVLGTCSLVVLHGSINLLGATISSSTVKHRVYAPRSAPLPVIRPGKETGSMVHADKFPPRLRDALQHKAIIALHELKTDVVGLGRICRTFEGVFEPSRWQKSSIEAPFDIPGLYMIRQQSRECHAFWMPPSWSKALDMLSPNDNMICGTYIIKGPKNSGKSTFARTLTNHLLSTYKRVAFLECDLGQSEFTPGGMVSLNVISSPILGPPFTHPTLPNRAHFIGSTTPRSSPSHYLDAVLSLIQAYRLDIQTPTLDFDDSEDETLISDVIPIVVNTMGWSKGLGFDLTQKIESLLEPTDIFDIHTPVREEYPTSIAPVGIGGHNNGYGAYHDQSTMDATTARVHVLDAVVSSSSAAGYTPADHRAINILSYFHARFPIDAVPGGFNQVNATEWDVSRPLCAQLPYKVDCSVAFDKIVLTGAGSEDVVEEEIARVLNGAIVGFIKCDPGAIDVDIGAQSSRDAPPNDIPYTRQFSPPSPLSSECVGLGLIRGVSSPSPAITSTDHASPEGLSKTYLHILTPLPHTLLAQTRVLVKGEMELPVWGMLDFRNFEGKDVDMGDVVGVERDNVPYLQWGKAPDGALGAEKRRVRRNLMRRGQM
ncbi:Polynucleotide 5'-hydroxyl-kinase GRC3 [Psilocybe cubensis]|uniref:Polynucleotide 5'-hydroxyl-kinase GRC3 n=2 Tax=Psilocybe cubensis TaxID=181762 RepID=A0ACB8H6E0_PSICU|nr:Polynucleotide 5'-hydroxyl-kinase GRC3 [Psilocybe cubensis]KAH9483285.1 Polynucleotide 5'-hydroxyl-kinase GRC3 [Psilocybe cubensis]